MSLPENPPILLNVLVSASQHLKPTEMVILARAVQQGGVDLTHPHLIKQVWVPMLVQAITRDHPDTWEALAELGVRLAAWRYDPDDVKSAALPQILREGPNLRQTLQGDREFWNEAVREGVAHLPETWSQSPSLTVELLRQFLVLSDWTLASEFLSRYPDLIQDWSHGGKLPLPRAWNGDEVWAWFLNHGGNPMEENARGQRLWQVCAQAQMPNVKIHACLSNSSVPATTPAAVAWALAHDPEGALAFDRNEYFERLLLLPQTIKKAEDAKSNFSKQQAAQKHVCAELLSHPEWQTLRHESGASPLWLAVLANPGVLMALTKAGHRVDWSDRTSEPPVPADPRQPATPVHGVVAGLDLWSAALTSAAGNLTAEAVRELDNHIRRDEGDPGWFIQHPWLMARQDLVTLMGTSPTWRTLVETQPDLFWQGTPDQHDALAATLWRQSWGEPAKLTLALQTFQTLPEVTLISPSLRAAMLCARLIVEENPSAPWVAAWVAQGVRFPIKGASDVPLWDAFHEALPEFAVSLERHQELASASPVSLKASRTRLRS